MTTENSATDQGNLLEKFQTWIKGDGKGDTLKEMGIDLSQFASKSDIEAMRTEMESMKNSFVTPEQLKAAQENKTEKEEEKEKKDDESKNSAPDPVMAKLEEISASLNGLGDRVTKLEDAKGVRQSSVATGSVEDDDQSKNDPWKGFVPKPR